MWRLGGSFGKGQCWKREGLLWVAREQFWEFGESWGGTLKSIENKLQFPLPSLELLASTRAWTWPILSAL